MDLYLHVKVLFGIIVGLSVTHLLRGVAHIVQHPKKYRIYWVHLLWVFFLFLYLIHYWWWEFTLEKLRDWNFPLYFFVALYAVLLYLLCAMLIPEQINEYEGFKDYFYSRRQWIFALMAILFVADVVDTAIKGHSYYQRLGVAYVLRTGTFLLLSLLAIKIKRPAFHAVFVIFALAYEIVYILEHYLTLG